MLRKTPLKRSTKPMARSGFKHKAALKAGTNRLRSRQRPVSPEEKALWDRMASVVGCIACLLDGNRNTYVSIHHIEGRTKPDCHKKVLSLCAGHHQQGNGNDKTLIAVHPNKAAFEARYGSQYDLLKKCKEILGVEE